MGHLTTLFVINFIKVYSIKITINIIALCKPNSDLSKYLVQSLHIS